MVRFAPNSVVHLEGKLRGYTWRRGLSSLIELCLLLSCTAVCTRPPGQVPALKIKTLPSINYETFIFKLFIGGNVELRFYDFQCNQF